MFYWLLLNSAVLFLSFIFLLSGVCKFSPTLHTETYYLFDEIYRSKIAPALERYLRENVQQLGTIVIDGHQLKTAVGYIELISVLLLWVGKRGSQIGSELFVSLYSIRTTVFKHNIRSDPWSSDGLLRLYPFPYQ